MPPTDRLARIVRWLERQGRWISSSDLHRWQQANLGSSRAKRAHDVRALVTSDRVQRRLGPDGRFEYQIPPSNPPEHRSRTCASPHAHRAAFGGTSHAKGVEPATCGAGGSRGGRRGHQPRRLAPALAPTREGQPRLRAAPTSASAPRITVAIEPVTISKTGVNSNIVVPLTFSPRVPRSCRIPNRGHPGREAPVSVT